jgi:hypothetical protein
MDITGVRWGLDGPDAILKLAPSSETTTSTNT